MSTERDELVRKMLFGAGLLAVFAMAGAALVTLTEQQTRERIVANERAWQLRALNVLIDPAQYDNDLFTDTLAVHDPELLGTDEALTVYRAASGSRAVALVMQAVAPDGYNGNIRLLVGIDADGTLTGVRVVSHRETQGLGDRIETERSDWILAFTGRSLGDPPPERWAVRRDGGDFDQISGATITTRAVIWAVRRTLVYFEQEREHLFEPYELPE